MPIQFTIFNFQFFSLREIPRRGTISNYQFPIINYQFPIFNSSPEGRKIKNYFFIFHPTITHAIPASPIQVHKDQSKKAVMPSSATAAKNMTNRF